MGGCEAILSAAAYDAVSDPFWHCDNLEALNLSTGDYQKLWVTTPL